MAHRNITHAATVAQVAHAPWHSVAALHRCCEPNETCAVSRVYSSAKASGHSLTSMARACHSASVGHAVNPPVLLDSLLYSWTPSCTPGLPHVLPPSVPSSLPPSVPRVCVCGGTGEPLYCQYSRTGASRLAPTLKRRASRRTIAWILHALPTVSTP